MPGGPHWQCITTSLLLLLPYAPPTQPIHASRMPPASQQVKDADLLDDELPLRAGAEGGEASTRCLLREHILSYLELDTSKEFQRYGR